MKILHMPFTYFPDPCGGTEVYVAALAHELMARGVENIIAAPARAGVNERTRYEHDGVSVSRYPIAGRPLTHNELYGDGDPVAAMHVGALLDEEAPDVVHMHAHTAGVSARVAQAVTARGIPLVLTYHTPTVSCQRGTLCRDGRVVCDGEVLVTRCTACVLEEHGVSNAARWALSRTPRPLGHALASRDVQGGAWTALRMRALMEQRKQALRTLLDAASIIVAPCQWVRDVLRANAVADERIVLSRQGVTALPDVAPATASRAPLPVRCVFVGRLDESKGVHLIVEALRALPQLPITLDIYGVAQGEHGRMYRQRIAEMVEHDARIHLLGAIAPDRVVETLGAHDATLIPSTGLETGPLVVLESFAGGTPVIGTKLGGIAELVRDGHDGLLVEEASVDAWQRTLQRIAADPSLLAGLRANVTPPRTMAAVAQEMSEIYESLAAAVVA